MPRLYYAVLILLLGDTLPLGLVMPIVGYGIWRLKRQRCVTRPGNLCGGADSYQQG